MARAARLGERMRAGQLRSVPAALVALVALAPAGGAGEPAREVLADESMEFLINGVKAGHARTVAFRDGDLIRTRATSRLELGRLGTVVTQESELDGVETVSGAPVSFRSVQTMAAQPTEIEGRFEGGKLHLTSRTMGVARTRTEDVPEGALFGWALEARVRREVAGPAARFSFTTYTPELDRFVTVTYEKAGRVEVDVRGERIGTTRCLVHGLYPGVIPEEYRDSGGVTQKLVMDMMGIRIEAVRAPHDVAAVRPAAPARVDINLDTLVRSNARMARQFEVDSARYRLALPGGDASGLDLSGPGQAVESKGADGSLVVAVRSVRPRPGALAKLPIEAAGMEEYLAPTTLVQSDDPAIAAKARELSAGVASAFLVAKRMERWVLVNMTNRGFGTGFASAAEVMRERAGDCSEHAVLLCALLRAAGIPARVAAGVEYLELPGGGPSFLYHMWTEARVGEWLPFDATLAGRWVDAAHVRLGASALTEMVPGGGLLELMRFFGRLRIEVLEYSIRGRRVVPAETRLPFVVSEGRLVVPDHGASFAVPDGWKADAAAARPGVLASLSGGGATIELATGRVPPGYAFDQALAHAGLVRMDSAGQSRLGSLPAAEVVTMGRAGLAALVEGTLYVLTLEGAGPQGERAFEAAAASFGLE